MSTNCPFCVKVVLDSEEGEFCDADCERWFHRECLRMGKTEYQRISADNNIKCNITDCKKLTVDPIHDKLEAILKHLSSLAINFEISEGTKLIKQNLERVTLKLRELEPRLTTVEAEISYIKNNLALKESNNSEERKSGR